MTKTKVLIAVKTYPSLSSKYDELVCTAGFLEDGSWIRVYPIPLCCWFSKLLVWSIAFIFFVQGQTMSLQKNNTHILFKEIS
jgi:hypothetical protein